MYLSIKQHDQFRTLLMSFELPLRTYVSEVILSNFQDSSSFEDTMKSRAKALQQYDVLFLRETLPKACGGNQLKKLYDRFVAAYDPTPIVMSDIEIPMVGALNIVTFALSGCFNDLYNVFSGYNDYCLLAEKYRYARNKLEHPGTRTLEDVHLYPVLSFVQGICAFLDDKYFIQKTKNEVLAEINILLSRTISVPVKINNFNEMPFSDSKIICRDKEIEKIKNFIYGEQNALRKKHSLCIYGYGGVGKTALVLESLKQVVGDLLDGSTVNEYKPEYILFFSAKKRMLSVGEETGKIIEREVKHHFETESELEKLIFDNLNIDSLKNLRKMA